jgi:tol-pal system protein YbgF
MTVRRASLWLLPLLLAGCVSVADFERVRRDPKELQARLADAQATVDGLKQRVDALRTSVDEKRGAPAPQVADLERRVTALEQQATMGTGGPLVPVPPTGDPVVPTTIQLQHTAAAPIAMQKEAAALTGSGVNPAYRAALDKYRGGDCDQAIAGFRQFVRSDANSDLADNAQYWIGECYYARKDYNRAIIELNEVFTKYPKGDRVPGALLALATSFADSGDEIDARLILQKLINDHPRSEEAEIGRQKLKTLTN